MAARLQDHYKVLFKGAQGIWRVWRKGVGEGVGEGRSEEWEGVGWDMGTGKGYGVKGSYLIPYTCTLVEGETQYMLLIRLCVLATSIPSTVCIRV